MFDDILYTHYILIYSTHNGDDAPQRKIYILLTVTRSNMARRCMLLRVHVYECIIKVGVVYSWNELDKCSKPYLQYFSVDIFWSICFIFLLLRFPLCIIMAFHYEIMLIWWSRRDLLLLLWHYNSGRVLAFSTISFHSRRPWNCPAHFISFTFFRSSWFHLPIGTLGFLLVFLWMVSIRIFSLQY